MIEYKRLTCRGAMAIEPSALGQEFAVGAQPEDCCLERDGAIAVVEINGPITAVGGFDTYAAIKCRVACALASTAHTVVLRVSSPGGDVAEMIDTARELRAMAAAAGKRLMAHTSSSACSSAYGLSTAASVIGVSSTGTLGSIGVIAAAVDTTAADAAMGVAFTIVASGARKSDGNPHVPRSEGMVAAMQAAVDVMAGEFFALVRDHRGLDAAPLQAATFVGAQAQAAGLADVVCSWSEFLDLAAATPNHNPILETASADNAQQGSPRAMADDDKKDEKKDDAVRAALVTASQSDDEEKASRAKRALAAYDSDEEKKCEHEEPDGGEKKQEDAKAVAALAGLSAQVSAQAQEIAQLKADREKADFAALRASRPDIADSVWSALSSVSLASARAVVEATPKASITPVVTPARAPISGSHSPAILDPKALAPNAELDRAFGLNTAATPAVQLNGNVLTLSSVK